MAAGALHQAISDLHSIDADTLSDPELHALVIDLQAETARLEAAKARLLAAWDTRRIWASDLSRSPAARLARDAELSPREAGLQCRRARKLRTMPATAAAFTDGALSPDTVDALARCNTPEVAHLFARDETILVGHAQALSHRDLQRVLQYWQHNADTDGTRTHAQRERDSRHVTCVRTFQGWIHLDGFLDRVAGTAVLEELTRLEHQLFTQDLTEARERHGTHDITLDQLARTNAQRRADALVLMAERSASLPEGARRPEPLITVVVDYETFTGTLCELEDGTVITPSEILPLLTSADIERIVFGSRNRILQVGVRERFFTGALRRAILVRDRHCQEPGCHVPANRCQVDHKHPYAQGGLTTQDNGRAYCGPHNQARNNHPPPDT